jgi:hypothetical protein
VKPLLGMLSIAGGFVMSLGMFAAGLAFAAWFIATEPAREPDAGADVASLWTVEPRKVDTAAQHFERLPALPTGQAKTPQPAAIRIASAFAADTTTGTLDPINTASVQTAGQGPSNGQSPWHETSSPSHEKWCAERYRSYRAHDNSYTSYSGEVRSCISPFMEDQAAASAGAPSWVVQEDTVQDSASQGETIEETGGEAQHLGAPPERYAEGSSASLQYALDVEAGGWIDSDHMAYCMSRYRSYRPEDNTYQPFGGGPRLQCE